jgi:hypothetical protein
MLQPNTGNRLTELDFFRFVAVRGFAFAAAPLPPA